LEAAAIEKTLSELSAEKQKEIYERAEKTVEKYDLKTAGDTFAKTYACPLFEKEIGCLVHKAGKPSACIQHACYENREDLPPDELQTEIEATIEKLNSLVYRRNWSWQPIPLAILKNKKA
jgi:hypothetical protein